MDHLPGAGLRVSCFRLNPRINAASFFGVSRCTRKGSFTLGLAQNALRVLLRRFQHVRLLQANKFVLHTD
jgi:hypothetical protein